MIKKSFKLPFHQEKDLQNETPNIFAIGHNVLPLDSNEQISAIKPTWMVFELSKCDFSILYEGRT